MGRTIPFPPETPYYFRMPSSRKRRGKTPRSTTLPWFLRRKILLLLVGGLVILAGFFLSQGRVIKVVDGDTIVVLTEQGKSERIRLYGIDAPESAQKGGAEATAFARDLLLLQPVSLSVVDRDRYGRTVALVKLKDGRIANAEMVREGHAWVYRDYCREAFCASWLALEYQAKKQGKGLWRGDSPLPPWKWRRSNPRR